MSKRRADDALPTSSDNETIDGFRRPGSSLPPSSPPLPNYMNTFNERDEDEAEEAVIEEDLLQDEIYEDAQDAEGIDLFDDRMMAQDYEANLELDRYDADNIDDEDYEAMSPTSRRKAEAYLKKRDMLLRKSRRAMDSSGAAISGTPGMFLGDDGDVDDDDSIRQFGLSVISRRRRRRRDYDESSIGGGAGQDELEDEEMPLEAIADVKAASIQEWILQDKVQSAIAREFRNFLLEYTDETGSSVYGNKIRTLGELNAESLEVSYQHLAEAKPTLAYFLANSPAEMLSIFDSIALDVTLLHYPEYERIHPDIHVRIFDLPTYYTLRDLRQSHLNCLVRVSGVVTRRGNVYPQRHWVQFDCLKCGALLGPFHQDSLQEIKVSYCHNCQSRGPFTVNSQKTMYINFQKITLQESPGTVPPGRLPRHREVILLWDLVDSIKPGDEIEVTGIYRHSYDASLNTKNGFPVFSTIIEANHILLSKDDFAAFKLTEEDEKLINQLSKDPNVQERIIASIAPSIFGHYDIKSAIAALVFGGVPKKAQGNMNIRGDINCLLLGDPGTAKSQLLKYVEKVAHRAVFTTGQGASAVGLTASVRKDPVSGEWGLEGGAFVLADKGICLIDEFDKMNDQDRTSIHEAMEQQTISISKAGIVTTLHARCSVLAAANPIGGRYNPALPFAQNVDLTEPILSRFDILCVVKDVVDPQVDAALAKFVVMSHSRSHPSRIAAKRGQRPQSKKANEDEGGSEAPPSLDTGLSELESTFDMNDSGYEPIPQTVLRKYIMYARENIQPRISAMDEDKVAKLYSEMRRESISTGSFPITLRFLESIIRISEAFAKMRLSNTVNQKDIDYAIKISINSFVNAQRISVKKGLNRVFAKYMLPTFNTKAQKA